MAGGLSGAALAIGTWFSLRRWDQGGELIWALVPHGILEAHRFIDLVREVLARFPEIFLFLELAPPDLNDVLAWDAKTAEKPLRAKLKGPGDLELAEVRFFLDQVHEALRRDRTRLPQDLRSGSVRLPKPEEIRPGDVNHTALLQGSLHLLEFVAENADRVHLIQELPSKEAFYASLRASFAQKRAKDVYFQSELFSEDEYLRRMAVLYQLRLSESKLRDECIANQVFEMARSAPRAGHVVYTGPGHEDATGLLASPRFSKLGLASSIRKFADIANDPFHVTLARHWQAILKGQSIPPPARRDILGTEVHTALVLALTSGGLQSTVIAGSWATRILNDLHVTEIRQIRDEVHRRIVEQHFVTTTIRWLARHGKLPHEVSSLLGL